MLNYIGQGALILGDPTPALAQPVLPAAPDWARLPMVFLATAATVIASQAVITGAFSLAQQAAQLGLPAPAAHRAHLGVGRRAGVRSVDQLDVDGVGLDLVFAFESSATLGYAYGMAVIGTITIVTLLFFYWPGRGGVRRSGWSSSAAVRCCSSTRCSCAANLTKLVHGAWLPLLIGLVIFTSI